MDLKQLYLDRQLVLMKAASLIVRRIGRMQRALGAASAPALERTRGGHYSVAGYNDAKLARAIAEAKRDRLRSDRQ